MGQERTHMVTPLFSTQCVIYRYIVGRFKALKVLFVTMPYVFCLSFLFLTAKHGALRPAQAKDFGVRGKIAPIAEYDPLVLIQDKLKTMEANGELELHALDLQKKTKTAIERPTPVAGITKAGEGHVFYYDPTYVVQEDIKDHQGKILHPKGTRLNPLETVSLSHGLLFFDGDDEQQAAFAKETVKDSPIKLILIKGAPLALSEDFQIPVYFDQHGVLTTKLGIHHVPALVNQEELRLRIEVIHLKEKEDHSPNLKKEL